jgi:hypothetical protein
MPTTTGSGGKEASGAETEAAWPLAASTGVSALPLLAGAAPPPPALAPAAPNTKGAAGPDAAAERPNANAEGSAAEGAAAPKTNGGALLLLLLLGLSTAGGATSA